MRIAEVGKTMPVKYFINQIFDTVFDIGSDYQLRTDYLTSISKLVEKSENEILEHFFVCINTCTGGFPRFFVEQGKYDYEHEKFLDYYQEGLLQLSGYHNVSSVSNTINEILKKEFHYDCDCTHVDTLFDFDKGTCRLQYIENSEEDLKKHKLVLSGNLITKTIRREW